MIVTPLAELDLLDAFAYINDRSPLHAQRWLQGLYAAVDRLETFPRRCPVAREAKLSEEELHQFVYKSHRLIFVVQDDDRTVKVLRIRHAARGPLAEQELYGDPEK